MATQVETRLPGNPLAKVEEHGKVIHAEPDEEEGGRHDGARQQTGVGDQGSSSSGGSNNNSSLGVGQEGTPVTETSEQASAEERAGGDSDDKPNEESSKSCDKKDFAEAPPPKVNPWTRKMNAVTVVSVNGQTHHGLYTPFPSPPCSFRSADHLFSSPPRRPPGALTPDAPSLVVTEVKTSSRAGARARRLHACPRLAPFTCWIELE